MCMLYMYALEVWCQDFADIKNEFVIFSIVKYGRSSSLMDLFFSIKDSYKFVVYHGYLNEKDLSVQ